MARVHGQVRSPAEDPLSPREVEVLTLVAVAAAFDRGLLQPGAR